MKTDTSNVDTPDGDPKIPASTVFELLAERRRRYALYYLSQRVGTVPLTDVAEQIATWEGEHSRDRLELIRVGLHHRHVPKLLDAEVVRYDAEGDAVHVLPAATELAPYLELAVETDLRA